MIKKTLIIFFTALFLCSTLHLLGNFLTISPLILKISRWLVLFTLIFYAILKKSLTTWILVSMPIGIEIGVDFRAFSSEFRIFSQLFLRLMKVIIAPILFFTLVVGITSHSDIRKLGRMGWKTLIYFEVVTILALFIGLLAINISKAGVGIKPIKLMQQEPIEGYIEGIGKKGWQEIILESFPENFIKSIYHGEALPIVIFSVFFGISIVLIEERKRKPILDLTKSLSEVMFKFTYIVMFFAPLGVCSAIAYTVGYMGLDILSHLIKLLLTLYGALFFFLILILFPILIWCKIPLKSFIRAVYDPISLSFATTSSEAALPILIENLQKKLGLSPKVVSFVIPTGYSFNLDGTTLYLSLACVFTAQAAGIDLSLRDQISICITLIFTSKGVAAVPRASLLILLTTATSFNLPTWPIFVIMGIDGLMDMARTSVNVIGNALASCVINKLEGESRRE